MTVQPDAKVTSHEVTEILRDSTGSNHEEVLARIAPVVYDQLKVLAAAQLRMERADHSLQPTALVSEAYLRLVRSSGGSWEDRGHFFRAAAVAMRRILIDHARTRRRQKRGGDRSRVSLSEVDPMSWDEPERLLALDEALARLEERDPRAAEVVQLRYFGGLSVRETAEALGVSDRTVKREWSFARAWLLDALDEADD
jgi:RNA polymerase sigma factor (TIGR02999 family)